MLANTLPGADICQPVPERQPPADMIADPKHPRLRATILPLLLAGVSMTIPAARSEKPADTGLSVEAFRNPPLAARPSALWAWLNGHVDHAQLTLELEEMKANGMRGAIIWDVGAIIDPCRARVSRPRIARRHPPCDGRVREARTRNRPLRIEQLERRRVVDHTAREWQGTALE